MFCEELTNYLYGVLLGNSRAAILLVTMNLHTEKFDFPFERRCVLIARRRASSVDHGAPLPTTELCPPLRPTTAAQSPARATVAPGHHHTRRTKRRPRLSSGGA